MSDGKYNVLDFGATADGPYEPYNIPAWNYASYKKKDFRQYPWLFHGVTPENADQMISGRTSNWQMTSNCCGLPDRSLENITLRNVHLKLDGGVQEYQKEVPDKVPEYPEVYVYGEILPAKGIYFRYINGLTLDDVTVEIYRPDAREDFVKEHVKEV